MKLVVDFAFYIISLVSVMKVAFLTVLRGDLGTTGKPFHTHLAMFLSKSACNYFASYHLSNSSLQILLYIAASLNSSFILRFSSTNVALVTSLSGI